MMIKNKRQMNTYLLVGLLLFLLLTTGNSSVFAQISLTSPNTSPEDAVNNVLLGGGVMASNITFNGSLVNAGNPQASVHQFTNTSATFPLNGGVLMETDGSNAVNDADLSAITSNTVENGSIIEFDFVPDGDSLSFSYIFTSQEYSSFTCSDYNDVFGFFISGPGISGPFTNNAENIAIVPGSNNIPVGINTVNNGTDSDFNDNCYDADPNWQANSVYFTTSYNTVYSASNLPTNFSNFNGSTVELTANATVICGQTYHIKLAISNVSDQAFDSGVFLRAGSFSSEPTIDLAGSNTTSNFLDSVIVEGCDQGSFCFSRPATQNTETTSVHYSISGSATNGVDYSFPNLPNQGDSIVLLPGENEFCLDILLQDDGINEGLEEIILSAYSINVCGDTTYNIGNLWIADKPEDLNPDAGQDTVVCNGDTGLLNGTATTSTNDVIWTYSGPGTITFTPNDEDLNAEVSFDTPGEYTLFLTESNDTCSLEEIDSMIITYGEIGLDVSNDTTLCENGEATLVATAIGGNNTTYHWGHTGSTDSLQVVQPTNSTEYTVYAENGGGCLSKIDTITVDVLPPLSGIVSPDQTICPGDSVTLVAETTDGNGGPYTYEWTNPVGGVVANGEMYKVSPASTTVYTITITDDCESTPLSLTSEVTVAPVPEIKMSVVDGEICSPASFELSNDTDSTLSEETYWTISDGQAFANQDKPVVAIDAAGQYDVKLVVTTIDGCVDSARQNGMLTVFPKPDINFAYFPSPPTILNTKVKFQNYTSGADSYEWFFENGEPNYSSLENPTTVFPEGEAGTYEVIQAATSIHECKDTLLRIIEVVPEVRIYAPNAFTPDNNEFNNTWRVYIDGINVHDFSLEIFNRWGEMVWESHDPEVGWNGFYKQSGERVQSGTYVWKIKAKGSVNDDAFEWHGQINVLY